MKHLVLPALAVSLLLAACGPGGGTVTPPVVPAGPQPLTLTGTVVRDVTPSSSLTQITAPWNEGAGSLQATLTRSNGTSFVLSTGSMAANGAFTVVLPAEVDATNLIRQDISELLDFSGAGLVCSGAPQVSEANFLSNSVDLKMTQPRSGDVQPLLVNGQVNASTGSVSLGVQVGTAMYVDRAVTITGQLNCSGDLFETGMNTPATVSFDVRLSKGWNLISLNLNLTSNGAAGQATLALSSGSLPTNNWVYSPTGASALSLGQSLLSAR